MRIHQLGVEDALASLNSGADGLAAAEARRRLIEYGPNRVERVEAAPLLRRFVGQFTHLFALVLWTAAGLALVMELQAPGAGMGVLALAIVAVILINGLFAFGQEYRSERALAALGGLLPRSVRVVRDGAVVEVLAEELVPGDVILVHAGDSVPADCRLIHALGVQVNAAAITGEPLPVPKDERADDEHDELLAGRNVLLAGTAVVVGEGRAVVFTTGMRTALGAIAHLTQTAGATLSPLQREVAHLSRLIAALATALGAVFLAIGHALGLSLWQSALFAIGIIVAGVPEGLLPTVTLALAMAAQRLARRNVLVKQLAAVEALGSATVICTDKTGTLTENRMAVRALLVDGGRYAAAEAALTARGTAAERLLDVARHCHTLAEVIVGGERRLCGDPMELALADMARTARPRRRGPFPRLDEVPFDSDRKRLSTLHRTDVGLMLFMKGALGTILPLCRSVETVTGPQPLSDSAGMGLLEAEEEMAGSGLRVLALAYREIPEGYDRARLEENLTLVGLVGLEDPPRPEVPAAVATCGAAGIRVIMVTGDHPQTATAIACQIGLVTSARPLVVTGDWLQRMSATQLQLCLDAPEVIFARTRVDQKQRIVAALQAKGEVVAVTGDGVNDAPALRQADIGVAMGLMGTDVAREAADLILLDDNFASIVAAVEEGRAVFENIRKFLTYILTSNIPEIVPYLAFVLFDVPLALTVIQILAVDLGTDMLPALALAAERPHAGLMRRPPRPRTERLVTGPLIRRAYLFLGPQQALAAMAVFFVVLGAHGWRYGEPLAAHDPVYLQATTACLAAIVVMQMANVFLCRSASESIFTLGPLSNRLVLGGIAFELGLILLIVYTPAGNLLFGTAPLPPEVWFLAVPFALAMLALEELRKWRVRKRIVEPVR